MNCVASSMRCDACRGRAAPFAPHSPANLSKQPKCRSGDRRSDLPMLRSKEDNNVVRRDSMLLVALVRRARPWRSRFRWSRPHRCRRSPQVYHRPDRAAAAARRDRPAAAIRDGSRDVLAAGPLDVGRRELAWSSGPVRRAAGAAGGVGTWPLGAAAVRRLCLGGWPLAGLTAGRRRCRASITRVSSRPRCSRSSAACGTSTPPRTTQVIVQPPTQPPQSDCVGRARAAAATAKRTGAAAARGRRAGRLAARPLDFSGNSWALAARPVCATAARDRRPGSRAAGRSSPTGGWVWLEGHWA